MTINSSFTPPKRTTAQPNKGMVIWFYGLPSSGKTTLAAALEKEFEKSHFPILRLDGDILRNGICSDLRFSDADRTENIRRAACVAKMGAEAGMVVVCSIITPMALHRDMISEIIGEERLLRVHVRCPLEKCVERDVKGLYRKALNGEIKSMTGIQAPFEAPENGEFTVETAYTEVSGCVGDVMSTLESRGLLS